jgi:hypothetical protein
VALVLAQNKKTYKSLFVLVIAGLLKSYPLLFIPFVLSKAGNLKSTISLSLFTVVTWLVIQIPFIFSSGYAESVFTSGLTTRILTSTINLGSQVSIAPYIMVILLLLFYSIYTKVGFVYQFYVITLSVILFAPFHAQWLLWFLPFAMLLQPNSLGKWISLSSITLSSFLIIFLLNDKFTLVGLFAGLNPYLVSLPSLPSLLNPSLVTTLETLTRTILITSGLWTFYEFKKS